MEQIQRTSDALRAASFTDIRCIECLLRFYDVRTEYYSVPAPLPEATEAAQQPAKASGTAETADPSCCEVAAGADDKPRSAEACDTEPDVHPQGKDVVEGLCTIEKKDPNNGAGEGRGVKRKHSGGVRNHQQYTPWVADGSDAAGKHLEKLVTIPKLSTKGHTGYLLFGRKPVGAEEQRVNGAGAA